METTNRATNQAVALVDFEKWISQELGADMVKKLKENTYLNYGPQKNIFQYLFENVHSKKSATLANLNTSRECDPEKVASMAQNARCNQLKVVYPN